MSERVAPLRATVFTWVRGPARPTISAENLAFFCYPASGGTSQALQLQLRCINIWIKTSQQVRSV
jgi:hypothetical protein